MTSPLPVVSATKHSHMDLYSPDFHLETLGPTFVNAADDKAGCVFHDDVVVGRRRCLASFRTMVEVNGASCVSPRVLIVGALLISLLLLSVSANASVCVVAKERGDWQNYDSQTQSITKLEFRHVCEDARRDICYGELCTGFFGVKSRYFVRLHGKCHPSDCDWGESEGRKLTGDLAGWYRFYYDHGYAKRYVYAKTDAAWPDWLRLYVWTDFKDSRRDDYATDEWFRRP